MKHCLLIFAWFCLPVVMANGQPAPNARTALVIGNARYEPLVGPLRNTVNDARAMAKTLREIGFAVIEEHNITRDQLLKAMLKFRSTLPGAEVGLLYFAGHGISLSGANYLLPLKSGYSPDDSDEVTLRLLAETRLFNVEQAVADMSSAGARCNIVILDACRSTAVARTGRTRNAADPGGLSEMNPPAGSLIAFATDAGQTALDGDTANGLYTEELLKHLRTPGLSIEQVFKRTRAGVLERSAGGQIPAEYSRLVGEDIFLAGSLEEAKPVLVMKAEAVELPTQRQILDLAKAGLAEECADALLAMAEELGPGSFAAEPLEVMLEQVKQDLKEAAPGSRTAEISAITCEQVLRVLSRCLLPSYKDYKAIEAKAHNRRGDALLLQGRTEEALSAFDNARHLTPEDSYILYNRGRAFAVLGRSKEAFADFTEATSRKYNQPGARKLALEALEEMAPKR
jgi:hypothetical protein